MSSIATMRGDTGETSLAGGTRVSKSAIRVEAYAGTDELNAALGFARSLCDDAEIAALTKQVQRDLFAIGSALATPPHSPTPPVSIDPALVDALTAEVHRIEAIDGLLRDWAVAGDHVAAASFNVARTVCRRAEREVVRLQEAGEPVPPVIVAYLNRLSDLIWLFARKLEFDAGINASLREQTGRTGNRWSRAW